MRTLIVKATLCFALLSPVFGLAAGSGGEATHPAANSTQVAAGYGARLWNHAEKIFLEGSTDVYVTGYAYHLRNTYTRDRLSDLNERAWGAGIGRTLSDERNNAGSLYFLANMDSHNQAQFTAGYAKLWRWIAEGEAGVGLGFAAFLLSRSDFFSHVPFPGILPVMSVEWGCLALQATYIPPSGRIGNVVFISSKISL